ncbi:23S rRNA pseudouridine(955/2504/2580) synthase RluC [Buchnera aphidicola]|uniref:23S rRNA pseudouridine(955/2504/2580) synthase RluC n=1 Tax=Buchnera aphidicola TaxID=9 RepID=UPI003BEEC9AE
MKKATKNISIIYITENMINQRIDNFLIKQYKNIPKSMIYRIIRTGKIRVNHKKIKPYYKLQINDQLNIPKIYNIQPKKKLVSFDHVSYLKNTIIYEDQYLLIINKPSGIAVHGGSGISFGIIEYFRNIRPLHNFLELVHRIDRDTSGIVILAKKRISLCELHRQLREKKIKKEYIGLVHGLWPSNIKNIKEPLLKIKYQNQLKKVVVHESGKISETYFKIEKKYLSSTLLNIKPTTGRTHQIRVHTLHAGYPIVFDNRYGKKKLDLNLYNTTKINRLLLHAYKICFIHPHNGKKMNIIAPLDIKFKNYLNTLV